MILLLRWHVSHLVTVFGHLFADVDEYLVQLNNLGLLELYKAHLFSFFTLRLLVGLARFSQLRKECSFFVVMVGTLVIFDHDVGLSHVLIDEFAIEAILMFTDEVCPRPKWFTHLLLLLRHQCLILVRSIIECVTTSTFDGPLDELHELLYFLRNLISLHFFGFLVGDCLFHVPFSFVDQIDIFTTEFAPLFRKI